MININIQNFQPGSVSHWSEFKDLIPQATLNYIHQCLPEYDSLVNPGCSASSVVAGLILGDGFVVPYKVGANSYFRLNLAANVRSLSFAVTVACFLQHIGQGNGKVHCYKNGQFIALTVISRRGKLWNDTFDFWYPKPACVKRIPANIATMLNNLALALWIIGDGSRSNNRPQPGLRIHTQCFSYNDQQILCETLRKNFNVSFTIHTVLDKGKDTLILVCGKLDNLRVRPFIIPHMHQSWYYKLPNYA